MTVSTSCVSSYPRLINSFEVFIRLLNIDFSFTIFMYLSTFAVVGTFSGKSAKYSSPPTMSYFPIYDISFFIFGILISNSFYGKLYNSHEVIGR